MDVIKFIAMIFVIFINAELQWKHLKETGKLVFNKDVNYFMEYLFLMITRIVLYQYNPINRRFYLPLYFF